MQLGITIPLQKYLKIDTLPYGEQTDLFYCRELHIIRMQGKNTLAAVNASNRFAIELWGFPLTYLLFLGIFRGRKRLEGSA